MKNGFSALFYGSELILLALLVAFFCHRQCAYADPVECPTRTCKAMMAWRYSQTYQKQYMRQYDPVEKKAGNVIAHNPEVASLYTPDCPYKEGEKRQKSGLEGVLYEITGELLCTNGMAGETIEISADSNP